jgi:hypothetical protein
VTAHNPLRPGWSCGGCGTPWPCPTRQRQLQAEYTHAGVSLTLYLAACMVDAAFDLPIAPAGALYDRFLGWTRRAG